MAALVVFLHTENSPGVSIDQSIPIQTPKSEPIHSTWIGFGWCTWHLATITTVHHFTPPHNQPHYFISPRNQPHDIKTDHITTTAHHHHGTAEGCCAQKNSVWASHWLVALAHIIGKVFLWRKVFPFPNFRPRLARLYSVCIFYFRIHWRWSWHKTCRVLWCDVISCVLCDVMQCDVTWCAPTWWAVIWCDMMRCNGMGSYELVMLCDWLWGHAVWLEVFVWCGELEDDVVICTYPYYAVLQALQSIRRKFRSLTSDNMDQFEKQSRVVKSAERRCTSAKVRRKKIHPRQALCFFNDSCVGSVEK